MSEPDLSARQASVLKLVAEGGGNARWIDITISMGRGPGDVTVLEELRSLEALGLVETEPSWSVTPKGSSYLRERDPSGDAPGVFDSDSVVSAFEEATGVRHEPRDLREFDQWRATHPAASQLPRVQIYDSPKPAEDRFGGHFSVRIWDRDDLDDGVRNSGLESQLPERGPQEYYVSGSAERANVDVMFWIDAKAITPEAEAAWVLLIAFLYHL